MPARPAETIAKGTILKKWDQEFREQAGRQFWLERFTSLQPAHEDHTEAYLQMSRGQMQFALTDAEIHYLRERWYTANPLAFWPDKLPTEPIVRLGTIQALQLAIAQNLPIDSYWMVAGYEFKVIVMCSDLQITRILLTPEVDPQKQELVMRNEAAIFITKREAENIVTLDKGPQGS